MSIEKLKQSVRELSRLHAGALENFNDVEIVHHDIIITVKAANSLSYLTLDICEHDVYDTDNENPIELSNSQLYVLFNNVCACDMRAVIAITNSALDEQRATYVKKRNAWVKSALE